MTTHASHTDYAWFSVMAVVAYREIRRIQVDRKLPTAVRPDSTLNHPRAEIEDALQGAGMVH
jgi:hypothetical protein